jgi:hypothetical protein
MARKSYVQIDGRLYDKDSLRGSGTPGAPAILGDLPDFVSPIDGQVVSGRAGLRDHCRRHGVVPTAELKGLPPKPVNLPYQPTQQERQQTRQVMADIINSRGYLRGR